MHNDIEYSILEFLKREALEGRFESTARQVATGANLVYNQVGRALERLIMKGKVQYRERGTERKSVHYYYLTDILEICREKWKK